jgi:NADH dehydrogenase
MIAPAAPAVGFFTGWHPARGKILMTPVHVEDVALAFIRALEDPATVGRTYELGGPERLDWSEMLRRVASAVGRDKWIMPMPVGVMKLAATLFDWLPFFPVTRDQLTMLAEGNTADPADLESLIGKPPVAFTLENLAYLNR